MDDHLDHEAMVELRDVMEGDFEFLLNTYLSDTRTRIDTLKAALDRNDLEQCARAVHSLKGSSINVGAMRLGQCCVEAEYSLRADGLRQAPAHVAAIESEFALVARELSAYIMR